MRPQVLIMMGSDSDLPIMKEAGNLLKEFGIPYDMTVASAHRSPEQAMRCVKDKAGAKNAAILAA